MMDWFLYYLTVAICAASLVVFVVAMRRQSSLRQKQISLLERIAEALEKR
jgi:hypothetical protein